MPDARSLSLNPSVIEFMQDWKTIFVGVDFTDRARNALTEALRLAEQRDAAVHVMHVIETLVVTDIQQMLRTPIDELRSGVETDARQRLEQMINQIHPGGYRVLDEDGSAHAWSEAAPVTAEAKVGVPADDILERLDQLRPDLLVLARNSTSDPEGGAGTYAVRCVRNAPSDVLLVRENHEGKYKRIVACVDFSEHSKRAILEAAQVARRDGATLEVIHIYHPPWEVVHFNAFPIQPPPDFQEDYVQILNDRLNATVEACDDALGGLKVTHRVIPAATHANGIVEHLNTSGADLVAIASRGLSGLKRFLLGSTAERVIRNAPSSVLVLKPTEERAG